MATDYAKDYEAGWRYSATSDSGLDRPDRDGRTSRRGWMDGYLDLAAGRAKWHLRDCTDHTSLGEGHGCQQA